MAHFEKLKIEFDPKPLLTQIAKRPRLWNRHPERRQGSGSPHRDTDDIWLRYHPQGLPQTADEPFCSVWYEEGRYLTEAQKICQKLMWFANAGHLGGILITRIRPGHQVHCHTDRGPWHAEFHDYKCYVALQSNEECVTYFGPTGVEESFVMAPGEVWRFDNQVFHQCLNDGGSDRVSLIVSMSTK